MWATINGEEWLLVRRTLANAEKVIDHDYYYPIPHVIILEKKNLNLKIIEETKCSVERNNHTHSHS